MAADLTENTLSPIQSSNNLTTFSDKNSGPIALAKKANTSIVEARILQFLSYANSVNAGITD